MQESDLVTRFPSTIAEFMIYLCKSDLGYHAEYVRVIAGRLSPLEPGLRQRLEEAMAGAGIDPMAGT
jgi:hypothetical protein